MNVIVIGSNGQLGSELMNLARNRGYTPYGFTHKDLDVTYSVTLDALDEYEPDVIINTAAIHDINYCQEYPSIAWSTNTAIPLVEKANKLNALYIYISTDYVFDGNATVYNEYNPTRPLSTYGASKLAGEIAALHLAKNGAVCRVSYLFGKNPCRGKKSGNFVDFIVDALNNEKAINLFNNTCFCATYAPHAADRIYDVADYYLRDNASGAINESINGWNVFHCANAGGLSHYTFAERIADMIGKPLKNAKPIAHSDKMKPLCSVLHTAVFKSSHVKSIEAGLREYFAEKGIDTVV